MINKLCEEYDDIYLACGATDFRKQIESLAYIITNNFKEDIYAKKIIFIFCNKKKNSIKALCFDTNGLILMQKKLVSNNNVKFKWPRNDNEAKLISKKQLNWLLDGLEIEPKKSFENTKIDSEKIVS